MALNKSIILVTPVAAVKRLFELIPQADFRRTVLNSFLRIGGGFMLALIMGTVLAALSAGYKLMRTLISPLMTAVKAVPVASFIIFALFFYEKQRAFGSDIFPHGASRDIRGGAGGSGKHRQEA
ncbi:MAG: hypothetical protein L6V87_05865 [Ruminococcus sp.]|nr:MAG: hypothetical protein L6V87_05865 [Ruminococcus sp.]